MKTFIWRTALGLGAFAGVALFASAVFLAGPEENDPAVDERSGAAPEPAREVAGRDRTAALERELAQLRRQVRQHEVLLAAHAQDAPDDQRDRPTEVAPEVPVLSPEEEEQRLGERFAGLDQLHQDDPVDPTWAPEAEARLRDGLSALGEELGIKVVGAECKTEVCRAQVEWVNYEAARDTGGRLAQAAMPELNCAQTIWLKEPLEPDARYTTHLYLNCQKLRAAGPTGYK